MKDLTLIIENVRTFRGRHEIPIRPLTILTGENSSGKTTLLAMLSTVCDPRYYPLQAQFNVPPYNLGNYETIASFELDGKPQAPHFSVGFRRPDSDSERVREAQARFVRDRGQVRLGNFLARGVDFEFSMNVERVAMDGLDGVVTVRIDDHTRPLRLSGLDTNPIILCNLLMDVATLPDGGSDKSSRDFAELSLEMLHVTAAKETSLGPTRTQPHRVYSQVTEAFDPAGEHSPFVIHQLMQEVAGSTKRKSLSWILKAF